MRTDLNVRWLYMYEGMFSDVAAHTYTVDSCYLDFAYLVTAYLEVEIWSLFEHVNLTTGNKIL